MDLYVILGLPHGASDTEIKRAYRRLARRYHPDINPGDRMAEARFRLIEAIAEALARDLFAALAIAELEVRVRKPKAPLPGAFETVEAAIRRRRPPA